MTIEITKEEQDFLLAVLLHEKVIFANCSYRDAMNGDRRRLKARALIDKLILKIGKEYE
jgi:hypothetical protein